MSTAEYTEALRIIDRLAVDERRRLLIELTARLEQVPRPKHSVLEFEGVGKHNPIGIDAQQFIDQERDLWNE